MNIRLVSRPATGTRVIVVCKEDTRQKPRDFDAGRGSLAVRHGGKLVSIFCGAGARKVCTTAVCRAAAANGVRKALELKRTRVSIMGPPAGCSTVEYATACLEGAILGVYSFSKYIGKKPSRMAHIECVTSLLTPAQARECRLLCECTNYARDLTNDNADDIHPQRLAQEARGIAAGGLIPVKIIEGEDVRRQGLNLLWAVGRGSTTPPCLAILEYRGNAASKRSTAVFGKGITFDSGGQDLKPSGHIETMRLDMAGAAAVLGLFKALAALRPGINVTGVLACAHNAIGSRAYFPGDIYRAYSGKTVEITNTDAEGRLALADAFAYVKKHCAVSEMIDLATLTGSVLMALGETVAGLFSNDDRMAKRLFDAGEKTGERLWRLPVYDEHSESMKSDRADLRNTSKFKRGVAGAITGAAFLKEFAGATPWAHLDIAGTAFNESEPRGEVPKYATGFGVRLLWEYLTAG